MNHENQKNIIVTGASSGIGAATARALAAQGHRVFLGARREDALRTLVSDIQRDGGEAECRRLDVTDLADFEDFVEAAEERFGPVDVLVNNAGVMPLSPVHDLRIEEWNSMIDVNLRGVLHGVASALPGMRSRRAGHIINVASVAGLRVDPTAAIYCATKYAVRAFSEGLRQENTDVRVTVVSPGFTLTELTDRGGNPEVQAAAHAAADQFGIPATAVADVIAFAVAQPANVDINELVVRPTLQQ
ncbi:NADP-dependent 3-hydroxy acid dehydrogenase YdfG [Pseudarthrobacter defluvii]|uniref:SDR family oxidoreductase n=1 Tax=Pseudarthrobacter defluvii TaxID=410837 RepID=UPI00277E6FCB|nr:SDR family oxidoreductase [Pseudarthrobacter defluvii]MDQ0769297.1 NADP-dependent 3-hydroxy acid dehydrogenase YdfG [Pseudarthrobacter defluvii]